MSNAIIVIDHHGYVPIASRFKSALSATITMPNHLAHDRPARRPASTPFAGPEVGLSTTACLAPGHNSGRVGMAGVTLAFMDGSPPARTWREALLAIELPSVGNFDDPPLEWRRLFSELLGTFFLVLVAAGGAVVNATSHGAITRTAAVAAPGLMVMAIILFMGAVSGAHLNPAVTLAFAVRRDFPWRRVPGYVLVQVAAATLACLFLWSVFGKVGMLGATEPGDGVADWQALAIEVVLTVGLVSTVLGTASRAQNVGPLSAVAVGGYIVLAGLWSSPISGASMNPARSFGPDFVLADFSDYWVYLVGPLVGALVAAAFAWILRGRGGDPGGLEAARGDLDQRVREAPAEDVGGDSERPT